MLDTLNRRSRQKRQPSGKRVIINNRDLDILSQLYRYRHLSSKDLIAYFEPKSEKRFIERLGQLFHDAGLIDRPKEQWACAGAKYNPNVYTLRPKEKNLLEEIQSLPLQAVQYPNPANGGERKQFFHSLKISQTIHNEEIQTLHEPYQRFVCLDEIRNRQLAKGTSFRLEFPVTIPISKHNPHTVHRTTIKPDGLYGIEYTETGTKLYRFFAIEVELSSPNKRKSLKYSSTFKKQLAYDAAIKSGSYKPNLGIPNLTFLVY
jgi:hypothetical protein